MASSPARLTVGAATLLAFFVLWATIAAKPWAAAAASASDPRLAALKAREHRLRLEAAQVKRLVDRRWSVYEHRLAARKREIAAVRARHARQVAAARAAAARLAAQQVTYSAPVSYSSPTAPTAPAARVVTLPPKVTTVTLPPVTRTASSAAP